MILIFDAFNGISGDMTVGALLDAGLPISRLHEACGALNLPGLAVEAGPVMRAGIRATKFRVHCSAEKQHRHLSHIHRIIDESGLAPRVREWARAIFGKLAEAEAAVHGTTVEKVHFHEVGAVDSIADIICTAVGLDYFGVDRLYCGPINMGHGTVHCDHGILPVPPPATALLLCQFETFPGPIGCEMTTPTGAAILSALAERLPTMLPVARRIVGHGAGDREFRDTPNVLRVFLGEVSVTQPGEQEIVEIQTNIDDMNPQLYGPLFEELMAAGALDAFYQPVVMKQGRPAVLLTVLCEEKAREPLARVLFRETTTLGLRYLSKRRAILNRRFVEVGTPFGRVQIKVAFSGAEIFNHAPEFQECRRLAEAAGVPIKEVYNAAMAAYFETDRTALSEAADGGSRSGDE